MAPLRCAIAIERGVHAADMVLILSLLLSMASQLRPISETCTPAASITVAKTEMMLAIRDEKIPVEGPADV
jgi:hypothetical protein